MDLERSKIGDDLYLCAQCGAEVPGVRFHKHMSICEDCYDDNQQYEDADDDDDDDYDYDYDYDYDDEKDDL